MRQHFPDLHCEPGTVRRDLEQGRRLPLNHWRSASIGRTLAWLFVASISTLPSIALAQETTTYTYDALGRLVTASQSGGPSAGTSTALTYDPAGNRTNVTVAGSPNGSASSTGSGASSPTTVYVIVPLNGYTLIAVQ
jgi:hypothetical protein